MNTPQPIVIAFGSKSDFKWMVNKEYPIKIMNIRVIMNTTMFVFFIMVRLIYVNHYSEPFQ